MVPPHRPRRADPVRHPARRRPARRGFGPAALLVAGGLALTGGLLTAAVVEAQTSRPAEVEVPTSERVSVAGDVVTPDPPDGLEQEVLPLTTTRAVPASPAPIDANAVGPDGLSFADRSAGLLSAEVPLSAGGDLVVVAGTVPAPAPDRPVRTVRVEVEAGLEADAELFAAMVMATLNDPRGWGGDGSMSFARTDGSADIRVVLASPAKVDAMCAPLNTHGDYSCGRNGHAAINYTRWVQATDEFPDRTVYRQYVINHEVGHLLGHQHVSCPGEGVAAPLMQQQSIQVAPCTPNPWPFPDGV